MVKNSHNNKVNNYINIVNDLKGLGLLQRKRRRASTSTTGSTQSKQQAKPQISGIEKTIIDNSPQLRRDVQQLANERSILEDRIMDNENRFNFLHQTINENPWRFMQKPSEPQRNLSDVQGDSLYLPSINDLYKQHIETQTDTIDVPIVDASSEFKRPGQEPAKEDNIDARQEPAKEDNIDATPFVDSKNDNNTIVPPMQLKPQALFSEGSLFTPERIRPTSPRPLSFKQIAEMTPKTQAKEIKQRTDITYDRLKETMPRLTLERTESAVKRQVSKELNKASEQKIQQVQQEELKPDDKPRLKEPTSEQRKKKQAMERREIQKQLESSKADVNPTLTALAKERELQDSTTNFLIDEYFSEYGGRKYIENNLDKDMKDLYELKFHIGAFIILIIYL
jgi:hypothetical protein